MLLASLLAISVVAQPASARHHARRASQVHPQEEAAQQEPTQEDQSAQAQGTEESAQSTNGSDGTTSTTTDSAASSEQQSPPETGFTSLLRRIHVQGNDSANLKALGNIMFNCAEIFLILFIFGSLSGGGLLGGLFICAIVWHLGKLLRGGRKPVIG
jgi:hypothetical protein